jgi:PIN domain nuclease of toxin-antitoxin system
MAEYLLDTHTLLWMQDDSELISSNLRDVLSDEESRLHLSIASIWELTIKRQIKKLKLDYSLGEIASYCLDNQIIILPVSLIYINQYSLLPLIHKDPFDRMIVATCYCDNMTLVSKDKQLTAYNIPVIW